MKNQEKPSVKISKVFKNNFINEIKPVRNLRHKEYHL